MPFIMASDDFNTDRSRISLDSFGSCARKDAADSISPANFSFRSIKSFTAGCLSTQRTRSCVDPGHTPSAVWWRDWDDTSFRFGERLILHPPNSQARYLRAELRPSGIR